MEIVRSLLLFGLAGLCEIGGGYLVWQWLRAGKGLWFGVTGAIVLMLYGVVPTLQSEPNFGRIYAAYGGIFVLLSLAWGWQVDRWSPDRWDLLGASVILLGVLVMVWGPRG